LPASREIKHGTEEVIDLEVLREGGHTEGGGDQPGGEADRDCEADVQRRAECAGEEGSGLAVGEHEGHPDGGGQVLDLKGVSGDACDWGSGDGQPPIGSQTALTVPDKPNFTEIFPAWVVEGMLSEILREIKSAVDVLWDNVEEPDVHAKITFVIVWGYVQDTLAKLKPYDDASLRPKHALCRGVISHMSDRLEDNNPNDDGDGFDLSIFAQDLVSFLTAFHLCLSEGTTKAAKTAAHMEFCNGF